MAHVAFTEADHSYVVDGVPCVSVTTVLQPLQMFDGIPAAVLERARVFGSHVDAACNLLVRGELDWPSLHPNLMPYVNAAAAFLRESRIVITGNQVRVGSSRMRAAGTIDLVGILNGHEGLFDFKATHAVAPRTVGPQTAGYDYLYRDQRGGRPRKRFCVHLSPSGYKVIPLTDPADLNIFTSALNIWHWLNPHALSGAKNVA